MNKNHRKSSLSFMIFQTDRTTHCVKMDNSLGYRMLLPTIILILMNPFKVVPHNMLFT